eukprot:NODE_16_length_41655_cov_0.272813.p27 type:complete len:103 gc:universal NODE_16_length_41655_cov_0.272813:14417-14725(+)
MGKSDNKITSSSGVRGGRGSFKWEEIDPAERDHYLGVSSNHTITRNGKDMLWYAKKKGDKSDKKKRKQLKKIEDELMKAELGIPSRLSAGNTKSVKKESSNK